MRKTPRTFRFLGFDTAGGLGGNRTTDTRIFNPNDQTFPHVDLLPCRHLEPRYHRLRRDYTRTF
jgi:hypothetical protein